MIELVVTRMKKEESNLLYVLNHTLISKFPTKLIIDMEDWIKKWNS